MLVLIAQPERIDTHHKDGYTSLCDVWSVGGTAMACLARCVLRRATNHAVMAVELVTGKFPYQRNSRNLFNLLTQVVQGPSPGAPSAFYCFFLSFSIVVSVPHLVFVCVCVCVLAMHAAYTGAVEMDGFHASEFTSECVDFLTHWYALCLA